MHHERYVEIPNGDNKLAAIAHDAAGDTAVLLIVGGPQYRVGSHRQFVKLARSLALSGMPVLRLDTQGMGDSDGNKQAFYHQSNDINLAVERCFAEFKGIKRVVLWGLCDAASACLIYTMQINDPRVAGMIIANPWVRQQQSHAQTMLKHYYLKRLLSRQFWQKLLTGGLAIRHSVADYLRTLKASRVKNANSSTTLHITEQSYVDCMLAGWQAFTGKVLVITSGNDLTAQEFLQLCEAQTKWAAQLRQATHQHFDEANHTFSTDAWRKQVEQLTASFIKKHW